MHSAEKGKDSEESTLVETEDGRELVLAYDDEDLALYVEGVLLSTEYVELCAGRVWLRMGKLVASISLW